LFSIVLKSQLISSHFAKILKTLLTIFPLLVLGNSLTIKIFFILTIAQIFSLNSLFIFFVKISSEISSFFKTINQKSASQVSSSVIPTTADSETNSS
jgi:hypothetical protein